MSAMDWGPRQREHNVAGALCRRCRRLWPCEPVEAYWIGRQAAARDLLGINISGSLDAVLDRAEDIATGRELRTKRPEEHPHGR